ncbi:MAG: type II toxin-antitoxin system ParD family antitoxin [Beijerinckiaceae bacterium]
MQSAEKLSITMSPEMVRAIRESVEAGEYVSTSEVVRDAVRIWQQQRREDVERLNAIRARIRRSLDDPRPDMTLEEVDASLEALFADADNAGGNATS